MNAVKYIYVEIGYTYNLFVALLIKHNIKKTFSCIVMKEYLFLKDHFIKWIALFLGSNISIPNFEIKDTLHSFNKLTITGSLGSPNNTDVPYCARKTTG